MNVLENWAFVLYCFNRVLFAECMTMFFLDTSEVILLRK